MIPASSISMLGKATGMNLRHLRLIQAPTQRLAKNHAVHIVPDAVKHTCFCSMNRNFSLSANIFDSNSPTKLDFKKDSQQEAKGFAKAFEDQEQMKHEMKVISSSVQGEKPVEVENESFASMLRKSTFMGLGDFKRRLLVGTVVHKADNSLFIDFGGKFLCVCRAPREGADDFHRGADVLINLNNWELSARFLGATEDITLLESEATLVRLLDRPKIKKGKTAES